MSSSKNSGSGGLLRLVSFKRELFPIAPEDFKLLKASGINVTRIPRDAFPILEATFLKGVKVEVLPWGQVYELMMAEFANSFDPDLYSFQSDGNKLMILLDSVDAGHVKFLNARVSTLQHYVGRYGFRIRSESKVRKDHVLTRLVFVTDPNIIPGFYFGSGETDSSETELLFHLSPSCRVKMVKNKSAAGLPSFKAVFEDKHGDLWHETLSRSFGFSYVTADDCKKAIDFFVSILSFIESSAKGK